MNRRHFIRSASAVTVGGMAVRGLSSPLLTPLMGSTEEDRVLVIIQLVGGNDGLNTVIPISAYGQLSSLRPEVLIQQSSVLPLSGLTGTGFHPSMGGMQQLWNDDKLAIVQGVGYPSPNFSHFRSADIYETGSDSDQILSSGWAGRYLNLEYPNYPVGFPNGDVPDPLAIRVDGSVGIGLQNMGVSMGVAINNTNDPLNLTGNIYIDPVTADCKGDKLALVRTVQRQTDQYGDVIEAAAGSSCTHSNLYPTTGTAAVRLANALKIVSQLICGGLKTKIYWVSIGGFDHHANQVQGSNHNAGNHATLLQALSDNIRAFQHDMELMGLEDRVLGMTYSEFGRRIKSNASLGTDHGSSQPMFLFGTNVLPGMLGTNPVIPANTTTATNLAMQYDFRSVYASILKDWFCLSQGDIDTVLLQTYQPLNLLNPANCISTSIHEANQQAGDELLSAYPNPFTERTTLQYTTLGGPTMIQVFDGTGHLLQTVLNREMAAGTYKVDVDLGEHAHGVYYARLQNGSNQQVRNLLKVR
ncbi:MAG: DUF1501 domain-containing protein [Flavobacteriales bacterium]|jgi:uncharacterized protein (DUF1501 family)|nr:DUF1501 domain-containing protein [Flavobacteriales bacterium]MBK6551154.1 DUF1501 domain-containing protein [Flavobacteriales bacterium]MBK6883686.1 DUF1501 domain-containing protein [Flavobacteriales bacterium]MBK7111774.1 DUF1501 domain-containing protein [Flavobacteriales bacterium]MBK7482220.1 DUF1501 domain-containing protein [Flavobacteriales bacterium]